MKKWLMFLFLLSFVSASVDVSNSSVDETYLPLSNIVGSVNLEVIGEEYNEVIFLSDGSEIVFGDFLKDAGMNFDCSPSDCLMGYASSSGATSNTAVVESSQDQYLGFVLTGENIVLSNIDFKISSDFETGSELPLTVELFEDEQWRFNEFSNEFLNKNWGCFEPSSKSVGPLIGASFYCEIISLGASGQLKVGADVTEGEGELDMAVYPVDGFRSWECSFDPNSEDGCVISPDIGERFEEGDYKVCVGSDSRTNYNIHEERVGVNCGFPYDAGIVSSVKDYSIFAQSLKYAAADSVFDLPITSEHVESANAFIADRYEGDCSQGCILPLKISGVSQNFRLYDVVLDYTDNYEWYSNDLVYSLETSPAKVDFSGTLDLGLFGIVVSKAGEYFASFLGEDIFRKDISLFPVPIIYSVSPLNPSVGIPVTFFADVEFEENASLVYSWNFGDNESAQTIVPSVEYTYNDLGNYTLSLRVIPDGNLTFSSVVNFTVETISPETAVVVELFSKKSSLERVRTEIESFSSWYVGDLLELLDVANFEKELARLQKAYDDSLTVQEIVAIMNDLYALDIPINVWSNNFESSFLIPDAKSINIDSIVAVSGEVAEGSSKDYVSPILSWQEENVDVSVELKKVSGSYSQNGEVNILSAYRFDIVSKGKGESYFVIGAPLSELHFDKDVGAVDAKGSTVIVLNEGESKVVEFYYMGAESVSSFVSPKLSSFVIEASILETCNFNRICEEDLGEDSDSCRSDCKPVKQAIWIFVIGFIFILFIYTGFQLWYKLHYESYLFKDRSQMYNLLMFVTNARARGMKNNKISSDLKKKGWSSERINYVIRKSEGKSTGMIELIPIEFISALIRKKSAEKNARTTTPVPQQNNTNINKYKVRV